MNRTCADDHVVPGDLLARRGAHTDRAPAVEQNPVDEHVTPYLEVRPLPSGLEVRVVRRDPPAVAHGERAATDAGGVERVVVVARRVAESANADRSARSSGGSSSIGRRDSGIGPPLPCRPSPP